MNAFKEKLFENMWLIQFWQFWSLAQLVDVSFLPCFQVGIFVTAINTRSEETSYFELLCSTS